jgi:hypothetical protein
MSERTIRIVLTCLAALGVANAAWMLVDPEGWYGGLPAAVPDFGPFNHHFVKDIGCAYLTCGIAIVWAAFRPVVRVPLLAVATIFYVAHGLVHVRDTGAGLVSARHWLIDVPGVYLPALVLVALTLYLRKRERAAAPPPDDAALEQSIRDLED